MSKGKLLVHHKNIQIDLLINYVNVVLQNVVLLNVVLLNFVLQYHIDESQASVHTIGL